MTYIKHLFNRISSYELINYIFLGGLGFILGVYFKIEFFVDIINLINSLETLLQIFSYTIFTYFLGLLISRVGSFVESPLKWLGKKWPRLFIQYAEYSKFIKAEKRDPKISILSMQVNLYRSLTGMFIILILLLIGERYLPEITSNSFSSLLILLFFLIIFYFSWKKQVGYVRKRVEDAIEKDS